MFCLTVFRNLLLPRNSCQVSYIHTIKEVLKRKPVGSKLFMQGWVRAIRKHKEIYFIDLVDGSSAERLQVLIEADKSCPSYGSSIQVEGSVVNSSHKGQTIELHADNWKEIGGCHSDYPFAYGLKYNPEYVRQFLHLRPRTRKFSSVLRIRNVASFAVHNFFQEQGYCFLHTPIITVNDCEGAGEVFTVKAGKEVTSPHETSEISVSKKIVEKLPDGAKVEKESPDDSDIDVELPVQSDEYFGSKAYMTVSGQLHLEAMASAMGPVYNFGPVFRAEHSRTRQHASEFSMVEAEIPFISNLDSLLQVVEKCIKSLTCSILKNCSSDLKVLSNQNEELIKYIEKLTDVPFARMTYDEAVKVLQDNKSLKSPIKWGEDLSSECKQCLVHQSGGIPVFVSFFPSSLKPFYMKTCNNADNSDKMAQCFDLFAPFGGEICGGSLREDQEEILRSHEQHNNLDWYLDLRKYGSVPHGGFGIGFDRLLQSLLQISNIRDIIPFPRRKRDCKC